MAESLAFLNGRLLPQSLAALPLHDAGFVFGATVTDLCRTFRHRIYRWEEHLARFGRSCWAAEIIPLISAADITAHAHELVAHNAALLQSQDDLSLVLFATPGPVGYYFGEEGGAGYGPVRFGMHTFPLPFVRYRPLIECGASLVIPNTRHIPAASVDPHIKHRSRMHWWLADREVQQKQPGASALLLDERGFVTETAAANVLIVRDGTVQSPRRERILEGISLAVVRELCRELAIPFAEADLTRADCLAASEMLLTSTPYCLAGVRSLDGQTLPWPGPVYLRLQEAWSQRVGVDIAAQVLEGAV